MLYKYNLIDAFINVFLESFGERNLMFALCSRKLCTWYFWVLIVSSKLWPLVLSPAQVQSFDPWCRWSACWSSLYNTTPRAQKVLLERALSWPHLYSILLTNFLTHFKKTLYNYLFYFSVIANNNLIWVTFYCSCKYKYTVYLKIHFKTLYSLVVHFWYLIWVLQIV